MSVVLLLDYSKAFDLIDHARLMLKLEHNGIRGRALAWMKSYLAKDAKDAESLLLVNG
jgi:hypothetical protein